MTGGISPTSLVTLIGGVSELYQGDLDLGRVVVERLAERELPPGTVVEDLHYGAIAVTQLLEELRPIMLVLVGAKQRGRAPGTIERRRVEGLTLDPEDFQTSVSDAGVGYVDLDLVIDVAWGFDQLPARTVVYEVEPERVGPGEGLSTTVEDLLDDVIARVLDEAERAPLFDLVDRLRERLDSGVLEPSEALDALERFVEDLDGLDRAGTWGHALMSRNRLEQAISAGQTSPGMGHADWAMMWGLIEETARLMRRPIEEGR